MGPVEGETNTHGGDNKKKKNSILFSFASNKARLSSEHLIASPASLPDWAEVTPLTLYEHEMVIWNLFRMCASYETWYSVPFVRYSTRGMSRIRVKKAHFSCFFQVILLSKIYIYTTHIHNRSNPENIVFSPRKKTIFLNFECISLVHFENKIERPDHKKNKNMNMKL